jgi:carboxyl-terminal processing protease
MKKVVSIHFLLCHLVLCTAALLNAMEPKNAPATFDQLTYDWTRTFAEVLQLTNQKHYKPAAIDEAMMNAMDAFLNTLDQHSNFLKPKVHQRMMESTTGTFCGVGIIIDNTRDSTRKEKDQYLTIIDTVPGGPADKAGIEPMDKIVEIDGKSLGGISTDEITTWLKGPRGTTVTIKVMRKEKPDLLSLTLTRDIIKEQNSLSFYLKDQNIYYLALNTFSQNAVNQVEELLKQATKNKYKGVILDLRNNSGGLLNAVVDIAGMFVTKGSVVVTTKDKDNKVTNRYPTTRNPILSDMPIFILINNYTASAAEILAGVLKIQAQKGLTNNLHAFLIGTKTFGKGSVQEVIPVSNNCAIKLTTSLYFLPDDTTIQGIGIEPDFIVERTMPLTEQIRWFTQNYGREESFKNHIKVHVTDTAPNKATSPPSDQSAKRWSERAKDLLQQDNQLRAAITLINLLGTARQSCPALVANRDKAIQFMRQHLITNDTQLTIEQVP